jgi:hypothetical protein
MFFREIRLSVILVAGVALSGFAQTTTDTPGQPSMSETVKEFDRMQSLSQQLHDSTTILGQGKSIMPVLVAIPQFRKATENLRNAVGARTDVRDAVRDIEKLFKPIDDYFEDLKMKPAPLNTTDFRDYSANEIVWETLTTAERIDNNLQVSLRLLRESERSGAISIQSMLFFGEIQKDIVRFKWLAGKAGTIRRLTD